MRKFLILSVIILALGITYFFASGMAQEQLDLYKYPIGFDYIIESCSIKFGVPREVICAVINTESSFEPDATSSAGAKGLMQIMDETNVWICDMAGMDKGEDVYDPEVNILRGTWLLARLYGHFGSWDVAFAAYNAGFGNVTKWLADKEYSNDGLTLHTIPYNETREYVERVNIAITKYKKLYFE